LENGPEAAARTGVVKSVPRDCWSLLVERDAEREVVDSALAGARTGHGRFVILYGQSGIGRSSLLRASMADAAAHSTVVLDACGSELERAYGFGVVRQLLEARIAGLKADEREALLRQAGPAAESALGIWPAEPRVSSGGFEQIEAVYRLVVLLTAHGPLLLAIDDLQWCDRLSLDVLCFLGHRVRQLPLTIIAAWRRGEPGVKAGRLQSLAAMAETSFLTPSPLGRDGVRAILVRELGSEPSEEAVVAVQSQTRGQPFLVTELAAGLRLRGVSAEPGCRRAIESFTPESVRRNVAARLGRHPETVQRFARAVSVLVDSPVAPAAALAEIDRDLARRATDALVRAGILRDASAAGYLQPMLQRAVYDTLSSLERAELHQRAAAIVCDLAAELDAADAERAAGHLLRCEPAGDARFARVLCTAAQRAAGRGALGDARRFYERALAEIEEGPARAEVLVRLAEVELASHHLASSIAHASQARALAASPAQRVVAGLIHAQAVGDAGDWQTAVELLEADALALGGEHRELELQVRATAAALRACAGAAATLDARAPSPCAELPGTTVAERELHAVYAWQLTLAGGTAARVEELCARALAQDATPGLAAAAQYLACQAAVLADAGDLVERELARLPPGRALSGAALRAQLALSRGELADAAAAACEGLGLLDVLASTALRRRIHADLLATLVLAETERDRSDEAARALALLAELDVRSRPTQICLQVADALARSGIIAPLAIQAEDEPAEVVALGGCPRSWAAVAHDAAGDRVRAQDLATEHLAFARRWGGPSVLGRALAVRGVVDTGADRIRFLEEAVAVLEDSPARLELARAAVELGVALRRAGRRGAARDELMRGGDLAHRCGADALAARARAELVATGARPRRAAFSGVGSLTAAERRVATLAAAGMTNREMAKELTVSVKTVSGQLTAIYLKLAVHDRTALAVAMQAVGLENAELEQVP
jgi:DNA-binding CsgD family transcriptional regulator